MKREKDREKEEENGRRVHRPMQYRYKNRFRCSWRKRYIYISSKHVCMYSPCFFFSFFFSNNKDSLFSDNKYFLTGRAGFHARSNWLGYPFFPRPFNYFSRGYLLHFCERNLSNPVAKIFIKNSEKSLGMIRSNSIFKNNKNSMKRIVNKKKREYMFENV